DLSNGHPRLSGAVAVQQPPYIAEYSVHVLVIFVVEVLLRPVFPSRSVSIGHKWIVPQLRIFHYKVSDVDAEAVDSAIQPESKYIQHRLAHRRITPVQIRLLAKKRMQIVLPSVLVPLPGGATEDAQPVV